jgi:N-carbamoyl-L-amino-acid hydrolase
MTKTLRVDSDRMLDSFNRLASIGASADGGVNRPSLTEAHLAARKWYREEIERAGFEFRTDGAGNHSAFLSAGRVAPHDLGGAYRNHK